MMMPITFPLKSRLSTNTAQGQMFVRFQSSFAFFNYTNIFSKNQLKHSKRKAKRLSSTITTSSKYHELARMPCGVEESGFGPVRRRYKYSALPRVPSTSNMDRKQLNTELLFSAYRPLSMDLKSDSSTMYEFLMAPDQSTTSSPWGRPFSRLHDHRAWRNVPSHTVRKLKPFVPPSEIDFTNNADDVMELSELRRRLELILDSKRKAKKRRTPRLHKKEKI
ncbi:hypothetical protein KAFR_0H02380 [Kazachstania africana CBS 2517]|uniref:Uncharacterized protein n=1 Tax=Kazachstania africana (strain ATCC 22294 / BCRC 22015 / CBS 2517 / CECT 1963 / NBRC 1671 / NRRL Y-8276) TaxID=1071382 RepID=H2AZ91_KAZAF|nr:hypothetical protein KAFR_0H02380 [Kazachstania africana CBS 2517]CCF59647.1 hypothetical protein KAFR_0H02380 [Kazachstania africana CBS 2517]